MKSGNEISRLRYGSLAIHTASIRFAEIGFKPSFLIWRETARLWTEVLPGLEMLRPARGQECPLDPQAGKSALQVLVVPAVDLTGRCAADCDAEVAQTFMSAGWATF